MNVTIARIPRAAAAVWKDSGASPGAPTTA